MYQISKEGKADKRHLINPVLASGQDICRHTSAAIQLAGDRRKKAHPSGWAFSLPESALRQTTDKTKGPVFRLSLLFLFDVWQFPTLAWGDPTLPS
ncbi:hypothetical protein, partial [Kluyvera georgiana]|uniref:hypothetical protein n=1 Tax=Kluyvera georgiana TaxID=73098 RepID=UPI00321F99F9